MKKLNVLLIVLVLSLSVTAQSFESVMLKNVQKLEQKSEKVDLLELSNSFGQIAEGNPGKYEANYYQALSLVFYAFNEREAKNKEHQLLEAEKIINQLIKDEPQVAENYILKAMCFQAMIQVDPMKRGYAYSQKAEGQLEKAQALDAKNPRYFFLKGQNVFYTPEQYGGGKLKAKPFFKQAEKLFKKSKKQEVLSPTWGEQTNARQLKACQK